MVFYTPQKNGRIFTTQYYISENLYFERLKIAVKRKMEGIKSC